MYVESCVICYIFWTWLKLDSSLVFPKHELLSLKIMNIPF